MGSLSQPKYSSELLSLDAVQQGIPCYCDTARTLLPPPRALHASSARSSNSTDVALLPYNMHRPCALRESTEARGAPSTYITTVLAPLRNTRQLLLAYLVPSHLSAVDSGTFIFCPHSHRRRHREGGGEKPRRVGTDKT